MNKNNAIYILMTLVFSLQILTACVTEKRVEFDVFYSEKGYNNFTFNYIKPKEFIKKDSLLALLEKFPEKLSMIVLLCKYTMILTP